MYDYEKYGDSPACLNSEFDIQNKDALAQGFGVTDNQESNLKDVDNAQLYEGKLVTVSDENCTQWVQANAKKYETGNEHIPYGTGHTFAELPQGINKQILCSRGIELENGVITVSIIIIVFM